METKTNNLISAKVKSYYRPGALMQRTAISYAKQFNLPLCTKNEYGVYDVAYPDGSILSAFTSIKEVVNRIGECVVHYPVTGAFAHSSEVSL